MEPKELNEEMLAEAEIEKASAVADLGEIKAGCVEGSVNVEAAIAEIVKYRLDVSASSPVAHEVEPILRAYFEGDGTAEETWDAITKIKGERHGYDGVERQFPSAPVIFTQLADASSKSDFDDLLRDCTDEELTGLGEWIDRSYPEATGGGEKLLKSVAYAIDEVLSERERSGVSI